MKKIISILSVLVVFGGMVTQVTFGEDKGMSCYEGSCAGTGCNNNCTKDSDCTNMIGGAKTAKCVGCSGPNDTNKHCVAVECENGYALQLEIRDKAKGKYANGQVCVTEEYMQQICSNNCNQDCKEKPNHKCLPILLKKDQVNMTLDDRKMIGGLGWPTNCDCQYSADVEDVVDEPAPEPAEGPAPAEEAPAEKTVEEQELEVEEKVCAIAFNMSCKEGINKKVNVVLDWPVNDSAYIKKVDDKECEILDFVEFVKANKEEIVEQTRRKCTSPWTEADMDKLTGALPSKGIKALVVDKNQISDLNSNNDTLKAELERMRKDIKELEQTIQRSVKQIGNSGQSAGKGISGGNQSQEKTKAIRDAQNKLKSFFTKVSSDKSVWKNADGSFNAVRLASDLTAGVVLGTVGGVVSGVLIKKSQVEKGFDALNCTVGGQKIADWGDEFRVGLRR